MTSRRGESCILPLDTAAVLHSATRARIPTLTGPEESRAQPSLVRWQEGLAG
jgi:hypothetical protein